MGSLWSYIWRREDSPASSEASSSDERECDPSPAAATAGPDQASCESRPDTPTSDHHGLGSVDPAVAGKAFKELFSEFCKAVTTPDTLAAELYSKDAISEATMDVVLDTSGSRTAAQRTVIMLREVQGWLERDSRNLSLLLTVLGDSSALTHDFADRLLENYQQYCRCEPYEVVATVPPVLGRLAGFLKARYQMPVDPENKWPLNLLKVFLRLAVVLSDRVSREEADAFTRATLHCGIDEILCQKQPIELADLLCPLPGQSVVWCVLVEGPPGVGKSTLAWELCKRWDLIPALKQFALIVLVRFRDPRVQQASTLAELFRHGNASQIAQALEDSDGEGLLVVLDGFDEFPAPLRKTSFLVEIIRGDLLPGCSVVVTSRPSATRDLKQCKVDKHIEVLGFAQKEIEDFASATFSADPQLHAGFKQYLSINPAIRSLMYVPLNCAMVTEIFKRLRQPISQTKTKLYQEMSLVILERDLRGKGDQLADHLPSDLASLRPDIKGQLVNLGEMAFNAELQQKLIFDDLPSDFEHFGFLSALTDPVTGKPLSHNFLHRTQQEFFAAFYFSQLPADEQQRIFEKHRKEEHLDVVWKFVAGLTQFQGIEWEVVMSSGKGDIYGRVSPFLVECLYEAQDASACNSVLGTAEVSFYTGALPDIFPLGWCVASTRCTWELALIGVGGEVCELLVGGLKSRPNIHGTIIHLELHSNPIMQEGVFHLKELLRCFCNHISGLRLIGCSLDAGALAHLADVAPLMVKLEVLNVSNNPVGDGGAVTLLQALSHLPNLRVLHIYHTSLGCADMEALAQLVSPHSAHLKELNIGGKDMSPECTKQMMKTALSSPSLEEVTILYLNSPSPFEASATSPTLRKLTLWWCSSSHTNMAIPCLAKALQTNTSLTKLRVGYAPPPEQPPMATSAGEEPSGQSDTAKPVRTEPFSELLKANKTLKVLSFALVLSDPKAFSRSSIFALNDALQYSNTLERLVFPRECKEWFSQHELDTMDRCVEWR